MRIVRLSAGGLDHLRKKEKWQTDLRAELKWRLQDNWTARSTQIAPAPCRSRATIGLAPKPIAHFIIGLITEKIKPALNG
jgi:hypothetical protein